MKKGFAHIEILVVILIILVTGGLFYFIGKSSNSTSSPQPTSTPEAMTEDDMSGWETYTGSGFSFKYPPNILIVEKKTNDYVELVLWPGTQNEFDDVLEPNYQFQILVKENDDNNDKFLGAWTTSLDNENISNIKIGSMTGQKVSGIVSNHIFQGLYHEYYTLSTDKKLYLFLPGFGSFDSTNYKYQEDIPLAQILSTFQFMTSTEDSADEDGFMTYKNQEYNFELTYPKSYRIETNEGGWPNAILILYDGGQSYDLVVEVWESKADYESRYSNTYDDNPEIENYIVKEVDGKFITLLNNNETEEVDEIISTFQLTQ